MRLARVPPAPGLSLTERGVRRLREIAPRGTRLVMRVVDVDVASPDDAAAAAATTRNGVSSPTPPPPSSSTSCPVVELFQRVTSNNLLVALNTTLEMETDLYADAAADAATDAAADAAALALLTLHPAPPTPPPEIGSSLPLSLAPPGPSCSKAQKKYKSTAVAHSFHNSIQPRKNSFKTGQDPWKLSHRFLG